MRIRSIHCEPCTLASLIVCIALTAFAARAQERKLTAEEVIQRHLAALGAPDVLARQTSRIAIGTVQREEEPAAKFVLMSEPEKLSIFYGFRDYDMRMIYDGSAPIIRPILFRNASLIGDKYEEMLVSGLMFNGMSIFNLVERAKTGEFRMTAKGIKKVGGRPAYAIQLKGKKRSYDLYFDTESFMWVRTDFGSVHISATVRDVGGSTAALNANHDEGGSETTIDFYIETSDFRDVGGVKLPFRFLQVVTAPILRKKAVGSLAGTITEYRQNEQIDAKMFK